MGSPFLPATQSARDWNLSSCFQFKPVKSDLPLQAEVPPPPPPHSPLAALQTSASAPSAPSLRRNCRVFLACPFERKWHAVPSPTGLTGKGDEGEEVMLIPEGERKKIPLLLLLFFFLHLSPFEFDMTTEGLPLQRSWLHSYAQGCGNPSLRVVLKQSGPAYSNSPSHRLSMLLISERLGW